MGRQLILLTPFLLVLASCAQNGFQTPLASIKNAPATTTYSPSEPTSKLVGSQPVIDGASQVSNLKLNVESAQATTNLKGTVSIQPLEGSAALTVPFDVSGKINPEDYTSFMKANNPAEMEALGLQVGAKLTCLYTDCSESFIDIYIKYKNQVYHHQVEAKGNEMPPATPTPKATATPEGSVNGNKPPQPKAPFGEVTGEDDDGSRFEHDIDEEAEAGTYVGEPQKDIEVLFPDLKRPEDKTNPGKKTEEKTPPPKDPPSSSPIKVVLKGLGQAVTALGKNNFVIGHLENATDILEFETSNPKAGFHVLYPKRKSYYGTDDMLAVLAYLGRYSQNQLNGYVLNVGDISTKNGGKLGRHSSHQMGLDADISYYFSSKEKQKGLIDAVASSKTISSFMAEEQWEMFKTIVGQGNVDRLFVHPAIKKELCTIASKSGDLKPGDVESPAFEALRVMRPEINHDDHFHLRLKCSTAQPRCRQMSPPAKSTGC